MCVGDKVVFKQSDLTDADRYCPISPHADCIVSHKAQGHASITTQKAFFSTWCTNLSSIKANVRYRCLLEGE